MIIINEGNIFAGLIAGLMATMTMTLAEIPSWKKWGLQGVFEWHENQMLSVRFFHIAREKVSFKYIFFLHFLNGSLAGIVFPLILSLLAAPLTWSSILVLSVIYGIVLWIVTLVPIHKPITGCSLWNHQLGHLPAIASLVGHLIYGLVLGTLIMILS